jgi:hypothetical protein
MDNSSFEKVAVDNPVYLYSDIFMSKCQPEMEAKIVALKKELLRLGRM